MAVTVSSDLSINLSEDQNLKKLTDKQELLRESLRKGEHKAIGTSQVILGFLVISYSVPLLSSELSEVVKFGVPWWSGLTFIIAGSVALVMERRNSIEMVLSCLVITIVAAFISLIALIFYTVDLIKNPETECITEHLCDLHYASKFSREMKSILLYLNLVQIGISSAFSYTLYRERRRFINYTLVN